PQRLQRKMRTWKPLLKPMARGPEKKKLRWIRVVTDEPLPIQLFESRSIRKSYIKRFKKGRLAYIEDGRGFLSVISNNLNAVQNLKFRLSRKCKASISVYSTTALLKFPDTNP